MRVSLSCAAGNATNDPPGGALCPVNESPARGATVGTVFRAVLALASVGLVSLSAAAAPVPPPAAPKPLPADVGAAWKKAGADVGWLSADPQTGGWFRAGETGRPGELPVLAFDAWKPDLLKDLPSPEQPFALSFNFTAIDDGG